MKILVVGGVAGGASFSARMRRLNEKAEIIMFERGEYISFANCGLPYYAGDVIKEKENLLIQKPEKFGKRFNIDVRILNEVLSIDRVNKKILVRNRKTGEKYEETYDKLVLSPGAEPVMLPIEGADLEGVHRIRTVPDIEVVRKKIDSGKVKKAVVIGAGFIGIEMAENLAHRGVEIYVVEMLDQVMPNFDKDMAVIIHREIVRNGVILNLNDKVCKISKQNDALCVETESGKKIVVDIVIMASGVKPEVQLAKDAGLKIGNKGILVDEYMRTSDPNIFAIGDAVEVKNPITGTIMHIPLAWPAVRQALVAANNIAGVEDKYKGTIGTSVVKVFSKTVAMTGINEKMLVKMNLPYEKIYLYPANHAGYYPGASPIALKILYNKETGEIFGVQAVGGEGTEKQIDIFSVAIRAKINIENLADYDFCYAPPYGSSKSPVNFAGMVAKNHRLGLSPLTHWDRLKGDEFLLDVRTKEEVEETRVENAYHIPVDELRNRLDELPRDKKIAVFCRVGVRAHIANRILIQNGFKSYNISGGYKAYVNYMQAKMQGNEPGFLVTEETINEVFCTTPTWEKNK